MRNYFCSKTMTFLQFFQSQTSELAPLLLNMFMVTPLVAAFNFIRITCPKQCAIVCLQVYKQSGKVEFSETKLTNRSGKGRGKFSIRQFAKKYGLGEPVAGNFFQAEWDSYVPTLYKQLEG